NASYAVRERFKLVREVRVVTAQGRLSALLLTALPFLVATCLILFNAEYFRPMSETKTGMYMMGYGILSIALGHLVIQRIVRIKVWHGDRPHPHAAHVRDRGYRGRLGLLLGVGGVAGPAALDDA